MRLSVGNILIILCLSTIYLSGQSHEERFAKLYPVFNQEKVWAGRFFGAIDGRMNVSMYLAKNKAGDFRGLYTYDSSGLTFQLEGDTDADSLVNLKEIDSLQRVTGSFIGYIDDGVFSGDWSDYKQYQGFSFELINGDFPKNAGWYLMLHSTKNDDVVAMVERRSAITTFTFSYQNELFKTILEQRHDKSHLYYGTIENAEGLISEILVSLNPDLYYMEMTDADEKKHSIRLRKESQIELIGRDHTTFASSVAILYPHSDNPIFNSWIFEGLKPWYESEIKKMAQLDVQVEDYMHDERFSKNALAEVSLDFVGEELLSGFIRFSSSMTDTVLEKPFIYSLQKNKEMLLSDFFTKGQDMPQMISTLSIGKKWAESTYENEDGSLPAYELISISPFGLIMRSRFSTLVGQNEILIHKNELLTFKKDNDTARKHRLWQ